MNQLIHEFKVIYCDPASGWDLKAITTLAFLALPTITYSFSLIIQGYHPDFYTFEALIFSNCCTAVALFVFPVRYLKLTTH